MADDVIDGDEQSTYGKEHGKSEFQVDCLLNARLLAIADAIRRNLMGLVYCFLHSNSLIIIFQFIYLLLYFLYFTLYTLKRFIIRHEITLSNK